MDHRPFCWNCRLILSDYVQLQSTVPQQSSEQNVVQLNRTAKRACEFCTTRRNLITDEEFEKLDPAKPITFGYKSLIWAGREDLQLVLGFPLRDEPGRLVKQLRMISEDSKFVTRRGEIADSYYAAMKSSHEETWRLAQGISISDTNSEVDWNCARTWIGRCKEGHRLCRQLVRVTAQDVCSVFTLTTTRSEALTDVDRKESQRPARLIDLGLGPKKVLTARLRETRDFSEMPAYATMSHCWGRGMSMALTKETYTSYHKQLPLQSIPRKFVQAMRATTELGLRYLWIDALCIVQDYDSECESEVAKMHHIYQRSQFNIAAASASSWEYPLWDTWDRRSADVLMIDPDWATLKFYCVGEDLWLNNILRSPLLKRGWVLQEITLAPRNLYFGKNQMFWECASLQACETWPSELPKAVNTNKMKLALVTEIQLQLESMTVVNRSFDRRGAYGLEPIASAKYARLTHPPTLLPFQESRVVDIGFRAITYASDANFGVYGSEIEEIEPKKTTPRPRVAVRSAAQNLVQKPQGKDDPDRPQLQKSELAKNLPKGIERLMPEGNRKRASFLHLWPEVVKRYTKAELSQPGKDKLAALSGLANFVHDPKDYLAGLWIPQLPYTLAWCSLSPTDPPTEYQAPSWSWAAINGSVQLPSLDLWDMGSSAKLINQHIELSNPSRTGRILSGSITIQGPMAKGKLNHILD